ncbi:hypothetical protein GJV26_27135 [Massilia dura]|uniref:DUF2946 domain-containing protein n=1 Tax=Pseudoduganella dura TaxID=321982 RepID=A0A6I3XGU8_9BURK|nr:hypothetical protein [Pseudoduganella dura]MUI16104.1 hypothetical protein [Pseudoduganella dura]GGY11782.1 hypothetical protein GCM10007386_47550 [Pseudoduganella dura]
MAAFPRSRSRRAALRGRLASWVVALAAAILLLQLFAAAAHHDHELAAKSQHCVACALHAQPHAAPPEARPAPAPFGWTLLHTLASLPPAFPAAHAARYLLPPSQAPPSFLSLR